MDAPFFSRLFLLRGLDKGSGRKPARGIDWSAPRRVLRLWRCAAGTALAQPAAGVPPPGLGPMKGAYLMSQTYLNSPSMGRAMSAEEFAAEARQCPGVQSGRDCGCGGTNQDCPASGCGQDAVCCQQMICCCHSVPTPAPQPPQVDEACCCKQSFRAALGLLCDEQLSSLLDFDTSAFLTSTYVAGATLEAAPTATPADNLSADLTGSFRRFSPCSCDLLDVDAPVHNIAGNTVLTATQVPLCQLDAVVLQGAEAEAEGDLSAEEVAARNFRCLRQRLSQRLNPCNTCGQGQCSCDCDEDCCCAKGLLATLAQNNLSRRVSLVAGLLAVTGVTLLGTVGSVLVLANDTDRRLYFVCVNSVQFVG